MTPISARFSKLAKSTRWRSAMLLLSVLLILAFTGQAWRPFGLQAQVKSGQPDVSISGKGEAVLQARIDDLQQQVEQLHELARRGRSTIDGESGKKAPVDIARELEEQRREAPEQNRRLARALDEAYAKAKTNNTWSVPVEKQISQIIVDDIPATGGLRPLDNNVNCRDGYCKIDATFRTGDDTTIWIDALVSSIAMDLQRARIIPIVNADGSTTLKIYAVREDKRPLIRGRSDHPL